MATALDVWSGYGLAAKPRQAALASCTYSNQASLLAPRSQQIQIQIKLKYKYKTGILIQMYRRDMITFIVVYFLCEMVTAKGKGERHSASLGGPTRPIGQGRNMYFPESLIM